MAVPLCVALITLTGCGGETESSSEIDLSALQPGNYRTTPRTPEEVRTPENVDIQEALRLGTSVPMIMETSPKLVFNRIGLLQKMFTRHDPPESKDYDFSSQVPGFIAGWETIGQRREDSMLGRTVELTVLSFAESSQAAHAARFLSEAASRGPYPPVGTVEIPEYPAAFGQLGQYGSITTWVAQGAFMVKAWVGTGVDIPPDTAALTELTKALFDTQFTALQSYRPTPLDQIDDLPVDKDGVLSHALVGDEPAAEAVMSPEVALNFIQRPDLTGRAFEDAQVDLAVHGATRIYRAGDPAAANRLKAYFVTQTEPERQPIAAPPGLPDAQCTEHPEETSSLTCTFTIDRYTVVIEDSNQIQDLHQQVAAQYLLLEQAT
ncbi:DUF7373 family lipoprotein [Nocardia carnea]|uniref:Secreted protein n=1 Tax=Nocardia carnea TaxID=37328 RepID=A0ABW7TND6_9NOCA|nr:hypothetical protein [Nocardia carnea]